MVSAPLSTFGSYRHTALTCSIHKARVFASVGIREANAEELRTALLAAASNAEARLGVANPYGQRFIVDFDLVRQGRTVSIRSTWIMPRGEDSPRLTSCYVL